MNTFALMSIRYVLFYILVFVANFGRAQIWGAQTTTSLSYSGISQSVNVQMQIIEDLFVSVGPKINYSKTAGFNSREMGLSFNTDFALDCKATLFTSYFFTPVETTNLKSRIHEGYAGYGITASITNQFFFITRMGIGGYIESSKQSGYTLRGLSYCANLSFSYRF